MAHTCAHLISNPTRAIEIQQFVLGSFRRTQIGSSGNAIGPKPILRCLHQIRTSAAAGFVVTLARRCMLTQCATRYRFKKRYRVAAGIDQPLRDPFPYATPPIPRPLLPLPPLMHQHATSSPPPMYHYATSSHGTMTRTDNTFKSFL
jgi:hypothetical protein